MATLAMRHVREGEVPLDGGTAVQEDADRPVFRGNGPDDYVCVECGNVLAAAMPPEYMNRKVRIRCGRCRTVNISAEVPYGATAHDASRERWRLQALERSMSDCQGLPAVVTLDDAQEGASQIRASSQPVLRYDRRAPFVIATVVRARRPTSVRPATPRSCSPTGRSRGSSAACAPSRSVRLYSLRVLETGEPLLLRLIPATTAGDERVTGSTGRSSSTTRA